MQGTENSVNIVCVCVCLRMHALSLSIVSDSCDPRDYNLPGSSVHEIFQARIPEWVACHFLLQGLFPTQESNQYLLHFLLWQAASLPLHDVGSPKHALGAQQSKIHHRQHSEVSLTPKGPVCWRSLNTLGYIFCSQSRTMLTTRLMTPPPPTPTLHQPSLCRFGMFARSLDRGPWHFYLSLKETALEATYSWEQRGAWYTNFSVCSPLQSCMNPHQNLKSSSYRSLLLSSVAQHLSAWIPRRMRGFRVTSAWGHKYLLVNHILWIQEGTGCILMGHPSETGLERRRSLQKLQEKSLFKKIFPPVTFHTCPSPTAKIQKT